MNSCPLTSLQLGKPLAVVLPHEAKRIKKPYKLIDTSSTVPSLQREKRSPQETINSGKPS